MGHWINSTWWIYWAISCSSQCSMTGITKAVVCAMGHWINSTWWIYWAISCSSQCSMTGITNAVVCAMGHWINSTWWIYWAISCSSQCSMIGVTKAGMCNGSLDQFHMVDLLSYFLFQLVLHDWCNKGWYVQWVIGSIPHGGSIELFLVPANAPWLV